ncbi:metal-dependent transcriptional regulator [Floricoccus penangensis]|uniref:Manganese transport regulator n=1 Tax=Floricoccus penangensis TaxID=1859475 RepID=A0A9Q5P049_9LACT|nr:metal-dependent transcriptional regulator [Floricoccus penangensis]OFI47266.1 hypothetical protein BG262_01180 [Floricoccus penangensis]URZ87274.1 metal-dependent transcriptional regulator [Floricoccus penangensis]
MKKHVNNANQEDYLKVIYQNGGLDEHVSNKVLSQKLQVSPPSVSEMLLKLSEEDYITYTPYKGAILTDKGAEVTATTIRNHRIFERFLYDSLDYSLREVHTLAEELEHVKDLDFFDKLYNFLGQPETCPHGSMINKDKIIFEKYTDPLSSFEIGSQVEIKRFDDSSKLLEFVEENSLGLGQTVNILEKNEEDDQVVISMNQNELVVPLAFALKIFVIPLENQN